MQFPGCNSEREPKIFCPVGKKKKKKKKDTLSSPKEGLPISNHNYWSLCIISYQMMSQEELKALQVSNTEHWAVSSWSDQVVKEGIWSKPSEWQLRMGFTGIQIHTPASPDLTWAPSWQTSLSLNKKQLIHTFLHSLHTKFKIRPCLNNVISARLV